MPTRVAVQEFHCLAPSRASGPNDEAGSNAVNPTNTLEVAGTMRVQSTEAVTIADDAVGVTSSSSLKLFSHNASAVVVDASCRFPTECGHVVCFENSKCNAKAFQRNRPHLRRAAADSEWPLPGICG